MSHHRSRSGLVIGIDLGGTNMQIGVVDSRKRIIGHDHRKTQAADGPAAVIDRICDGVYEACREAEVDLKKVNAIGIAAPGAIDIPRGIVLEAPNLRWKNVALRERLFKILRRPVVLDNDVNAAIWGEYRARQLQKIAPDALGVWLGTGVGGGLVIGGKLFHGAFFTAGEIGQTVIQPEGRKGRRIVEDFCSRTGMSRSVKLRLAEFPKSILRHNSNAIIGSHDLRDAFLRKDRLAVNVVHEAAQLLGVAIANWVTVLSLDTVIIGGGVAEVFGERLLKLVRKHFETSVFPARCRKCKLLMTTLGKDAGVIGAAILARESS